MKKYGALGFMGILCLAGGLAVAEPKGDGGEWIFDFANARAIAVFHEFEKYFNYVVVAPASLNNEFLTLRTAQPVGLDAVFEMLLAALQPKKYYAVLNKAQRGLEIIPLDKLDKQKLRWVTNPSPESLKDSDEIVYAKIPMDQSSAQSVKTYLMGKMRLPDWVKMEVDPSQNELGVIASTRLLKQIIAEVRIADKALAPLMQGLSYRVFYLQYLKARFAFQFLSDFMKLKEGQEVAVAPGGGGLGGGGLGSLGSSPVNPTSRKGPGGSGGDVKGLPFVVGMVGPVQYQVYLNEAINALHVVAPPSVIATIELFLRQIDIESLERTKLPSLPNTRMFTLNYMKVDTAMDMLFGLFQSLYGEKGGSTESSGPLSPPKKGPDDPTSKGPEGTITKEIPGRISFIANRATNAIMVLAQKEDLDVVADAIVKFDVRFDQVLIEIMAMEVLLKDDWQFGVAYHMLNQVITGQQTGGSPIGVDAKHLEGFSGNLISKLELEPSMVLFSSDKIEALLRMLKKNTKVSVLSAPKVVAQNNRTAKITVADTTYYIVKKTVPRPGPTPGTFVDDVVKDYKPLDTGLVMTVTPNINNERQVALDIALDLSEITGAPIEEGAPPGTSKRVVEISVMVDHGETVFLGGIVKTRKEDVQLQTPILSSIPLIGSLFSSTTEGKVNRELVLFVTPRVLRTQGQFRELMEVERQHHKLVDWPAPNE